MAGQGIVSPVLPLFAREFGVGATAVGFVVAAFGFSRLFLNLPSGLIGERFGRKVLMGGGLIVSAAGALLTGLSTNIWVMMAWRLIAGAGSAMYMTGAMSFIADIATPDNRGRLMSLQQGSLLLGTDIGPIIGGFVADTLGYRWPFFIAAMLSCVAAAWVLSRLPETRKTEEPATAPEPTRETMKKRGWDFPAIQVLLANPTFVLVSLFTLMVFFTRVGSRQTVLPLLAVDEVGMSATQLGFLFTVMTTVNLLLVLPAGAMTDRFGRKAVIFPGTLLTVGGLVMFMFVGETWGFYVAGIILSLGTGVTGPAPAAYAADLAPAGKTGVTMGLYRTFGDVGFIIGPILLGGIADVFVNGVAGVSGLGLAMAVNAMLIGAIGLLVVLAAKETVGRRRTSGGLGGIG
jgi:MFS family permease